MVLSAAKTHLLGAAPSCDENTPCPGNQLCLGGVCGENGQGCSGAVDCLGNGSALMVPSQAPCQERPCDVGEVQRRWDMYNPKCL